MDIQEIQIAFGKRVRELRKAKGLTQEEFARIIDKSVDTISNIERGFSATKMSTAALIAHELGAELADLFTTAEKNTVLFSDDIQMTVSRLIDIAGEDKLLSLLQSLENTLEK